MSDYYDHFTNVCKEMKYYVGYKSNDRIDANIDFDKVEQLRTELPEHLQGGLFYDDYLNGIVFVLDLYGWCLRFNSGELENTVVNTVNTPNKFVEYFTNIWYDGLLQMEMDIDTPLSPISFMSEDEITPNDWDEVCRQLQFDE